MNPHPELDLFFILNVNENVSKALWELRQCEKYERKKSFPYCIKIINAEMSAFFNILGKLKHIWNLV